MFLFVSGDFIKLFFHHLCAESVFFIMSSSGSKILLFDVDGTLTLPRQVSYTRQKQFPRSKEFLIGDKSFAWCTEHFFLQVITPEFYKFLTETVKGKCPIALVGGSDLVKILEQLGGSQGL